MIILIILLLLIIFNEEEIIFKLLLFYYKVKFINIYYNIEMLLYLVIILELNN